MFANLFRTRADEQADISTGCWSTNANSHLTRTNCTPHRSSDAWTDKGSIGLADKSYCNTNVRVSIILSPLPFFFLQFILFISLLWYLLNLYLSFFPFFLSYINFNHSQSVYHQRIFLLQHRQRPQLYNRLLNVRLFFTIGTLSFWTLSFWTLSCNDSIESHSFLSLAPYSHTQSNSKPY